MTSKLFYFSGTGNSLAVTRKIAEQIGTSNIHNMVNFIGMEINEEVIGFIFPVYFQDMPEIVKNFINNLNFKNNPYIFAIATCNGGPGFTLFSMDQILKSRGQKLSSGFTLTMPGNSVIIMDLTSNQIVQKERLVDSKVKIKTISEMINKRIKSGIEGKNSVKYKLEGSITRFIATKIYKAHKRFITNEKCIKCSMCQRICPENNIELNEEVKWGNKCSLCLACFHWCSQKGIELGKSTENRIRYHHPDVKLTDMLLR